MSNQDDIPTPRQTGSWAISVGRAGALVTRLRRATSELRARASEQRAKAVGYRSANIIMRRLEQADICEGKSKLLESEADLCGAKAEALELMIDMFKAWPNLATCTCHAASRDMVERQREPLRKLLQKYTDETDAICKTLGPSY